MTVRRSKVLQKTVSGKYAEYCAFDGSPIDDAMLEIQVLVGDAHAVYVRVADILPVEDQVGFKLL